jgi:hypothetical protein
MLRCGTLLLVIVIMATTILAGCTRKAAPPQRSTAGDIDSGSRPFGSRSSGSRARWPKIGRLSGTEQELTRLLSISGVTVDDHGQRRLGPGRWQVSVNVADQKAVDELSSLGFSVTLQDPIVVDRQTLGLPPMGESRD